MCRMASNENVSFVITISNSNFSYLLHCNFGAGKSGKRKNKGLANGAGIHPFEIRSVLLSVHMHVCLCVAFRLVSRATSIAIALALFHVVCIESQTRKNQTKRYIV